MTSGCKHKSRRISRRQAQRGLSLVELLVVMALAAMVAGCRRVSDNGADFHKTTVYASSQTHSSFIKAALITGLASTVTDTSRVRTIETDDQLRMALSNTGLHLSEVQRALARINASPASINLSREAGPHRRAALKVSDAARARVHLRCCPLRPSTRHPTSRRCTGARDAPTPPHATTSSFCSTPRAPPHARGMPAALCGESGVRIYEVSQFGEMLSVRLPRLL